MSIYIYIYIYNIYIFYTKFMKDTRRNKSKVDSIETRLIGIAHLLP